MQKFDRHGQVTLNSCLRRHVYLVCLGIVRTTEALQKADSANQCSRHVALEMSEFGLSYCVHLGHSAPQAEASDPGKTARCRPQMVLVNIHPRITKEEIYLSK